MFFYRNRYSILFRPIAAVLVCLFVINDIAWAQDSFVPKYSTLAPATQLSEPEFREKTVFAQFLLSVDALRKHINAQVEREINDVFKTTAEWKKHRTHVIDDIYDSAIRGRIKGRVGGLRSVVFVKMAGFLASTGQAAFVDLTGQIEASKEFNGLPVVYIDSMLCNTPDRNYQRHEIDEILQWENFRIHVLHIDDKKAMARWIRSHISSAHQTAKIFCGYSYPIRNIDSEVRRTTDFDYEYIRMMLQMYGTDERSIHLNVAAQDSSQRFDASEKGKRKTGASKWELLEQFRRKLKDLPEEVVSRLRQTNDLGEQRKILVGSGLSVTNAIDGKFLIRELNVFLQQRQAVEPVADSHKRHILRYAGDGRQLITYGRNSFDFIVKMPKDFKDPEKLNVILNGWINKGYKVAGERLNGLAVPTMVINALDGSSKPFRYLLEKRGAQETSLAIIQKRVVPVYERLKALVKERKVSEAKDLIDKYKDFTLAMFKRGVMDFDFTYPYYNCGIDLETGKIYVYDFGDLISDESAIGVFLENMGITDKYFMDDLINITGQRSSVGEELARYYELFPVMFDTESGESLFGVDLKSGNMDNFRMSFPYTEAEIRHIFMNHSVTSQFGRQSGGMDPSMTKTVIRDLLKQKPELAKLTAEQFLAYIETNHPGILEAMSEADKLTVVKEAIQGPSAAPKKKPESPDMVQKNADIREASQNDMSPTSPEIMNQLACFDTLTTTRIIKDPVNAQNDIHALVTQLILEMENIKETVATDTDPAISERLTNVIEKLQEAESKVAIVPPAEWASRSYDALREAWYGLHCGREIFEGMIDLTSDNGGRFDSQYYRQMDRVMNLATTVLFRAYIAFTVTHHPVKELEDRFKMLLVMLRDKDMGGVAELIPAVEEASTYYDRRDFINMPRTLGRVIEAAEVLFREARNNNARKHAISAYIYELYNIALLCLVNREFLIKEAPARMNDAPLADLEGRVVHRTPIESLFGTMGANLSTPDRSKSAAKNPNVPLGNVPENTVAAPKPILYPRKGAPFHELDETTGDYRDAHRFLDEIGVRRGHRIIEVSNYCLTSFGFAAASLGAHYVGFEMDSELADMAQTYFGNYYTESYGGSAKEVSGEFSSGARSASKTTEDHSEDFVLILTGALSDPFPVSIATEVFNEALRVIKNKGKIVISTVGLWELKEKDEAISTMNRVLNSSKWAEKVKLEFKGTAKWGKFKKNAEIYEVVFTRPLPDTAGQALRRGQTSRRQPCSGQCRGATPCRSAG